MFTRIVSIALVAGLLTGCGMLQGGGPSVEPQAQSDLASGSGYLITDARAIDGEVDESLNIARTILYGLDSNFQFDRQGNELFAYRTFEAVAQHRPTEGEEYWYVRAVEENEGIRVTVGNFNQWYHRRNANPDLSLFWSRMRYFLEDLPEYEWPSCSGYWRVNLLCNSTTDLSTTPPEMQ